MDQSESGIIGVQGCR